MKKQLLLFVLVMLPLVASANAVEIDGIYYNLIAKGNVAEVTKNPYGYTGSITIPESVKYNNVYYSVNIGEGAFANCSGLTSVTIPNSVTSIGYDAFWYCSGLTSVHISDIGAWCNISFNSESSNPLLYAHHLFLNGKEIKDLLIPNSVTSIGSYAFYGCSGLTSITIPNSVTSIGSAAFENCSGLTSVTIPNSVTSIGNLAFSGCSGLTSVTIPNSVKSIGVGAFENCSGLTSVTIPNSVTSIGNSTFYGCSGLTSITIPNSVTSIRMWAFSYCSGLTSVIIPNSVTYIGESAFNDCPKIKDVYCYAEEVPDTRSDAFMNSYTEYATLHVPSSAVNAYKAVYPWKYFKSIVAIDDDKPKCDKPTISYENGQLKMSCATEGVGYVTDITDADIKKHYDATISLTETYNISVYATKTGYNNSDVTTATLCWIEATPQTEGISNEIAQIPARALMIQNNGGILNIQGAEDGTPINVYSVNGCQVGSAVSSNGQATVNTTLQSGSVAIVKIEERSVKVVVK